MRTFVYPASFRREAKPGVLVIAFRDVPEAITQGNGERVAVWQAADCLEEAIAGRIADGLEIPTASRAARGERLIPVPAPMAAKAVSLLGYGPAVGKFIKVNDTWLEVAGVLGEQLVASGQSSGGKMQDLNNIVYIPLNTFQYRYFDASSYMKDDLD